MSQNLIFSSAEILLPDLSVKDEGWRAWSVIACDQFTSDLSYWADAERIVGSSPSVLSRILPEAYLGTDREEPWKEIVRKTMEKAEEGMKAYPDSFVYLKRTLPDGSVRKGIVGKIDLQAYDYAKGSVSPVRATEATVTERIPPRQAIRREAPVEIPHILILMDDPENKVFSLEFKMKDKIDSEEVSQAAKYVPYLEIVYCHTVSPFKYFVSKLILTYKTANVNTILQNSH